MSMFESIKPLLRICQMLGFAPFSVNKNTLKWELDSNLKIWSIICIILNGIILLNGLIFFDLFVNYSGYSGSKIRFILNILLIFLSHLIAMFALLETFIKREQIVQVLNKIENLETFYKDKLCLTVDHLRLKNNCRRYIMIWFSEIIGVALINTSGYILTNSIFLIRAFFIFILSYALFKLMYFYLMMFVSIINCHLEVLNKFLESIAKENGYYIRDWVPNQHRKKIIPFVRSKIDLDPETLSLLRVAYTEIWTVSVQVQNFFHWTLPFGISYEFYFLTFFGYMTFIILFLNLGGITPVSVIRMLVFFNSLIVFAQTCSHSTEYVSKSIKKT